MKKIHKNKLHKLGREYVLLRDKVCLRCKKGGVLHASHIYPRGKYPRMQFLTENVNPLPTALPTLNEPVSKLSVFSTKKGAESKVINDDVISTISPCLFSSKYCANCFAGFKNLNLNLTGVVLLNVFGVGIFVVFVIGFKPEVRV